MFKALADTLAHHFSTSVFSRLNAGFWDAETSARTTPLFRWKFIKTKYRVDAWHLSNSAWICCLPALAFTHRPVLPVFVEYPLALVVYVLVFNLFYNHILLRK